MSDNSNFIDYKFQIRNVFRKEFNDSDDRFFKMSINIPADMVSTYDRAAELIDERINWYAQKYPNRGPETYLHLIVADLAIKYTIALKENHQAAQMGEDLLALMTKTLGDGK